MTAKSPKKDLPVVDVFAEEPKKKPATDHHKRRMVVEVEDEPTAPAPELPTPEDVSVSTEEIPTRTVAAQPSGDMPEPTLPSFFEQDLKGEPEPEQAGTPVATQEAEPLGEHTPTTHVLETAVPQAFVGELNEIGQDVKEEKRGVLTLVLILLGVLLIGGGVVALILMRTGFVGMTEPTPTSTPAPLVVTTPVPVIEATPTPVASASASASPSATLKVNVLNGTKTPGLAAKQAAVLKAAGFTTGTVGNGLPAEAGTIVVPKGQKAFGESIAAALPDFTFVVTEAAVSTATVTLGEMTP